MKKKPMKNRMSNMMKEFEASSYDKDTKSAPEGSMKDKARDKSQMKNFMKMKGKKK